MRDRPEDVNCETCCCWTETDHCCEGFAYGECREGPVVVLKRNDDYCVRAWRETWPTKAPIMHFAMDNLGREYGFFESATPAETGYEQPDPRVTDEAEGEG